MQLQAHRFTLIAITIVVAVGILAVWLGWERDQGPGPQSATPEPSIQQGSDSSAAVTGTAAIPTGTIPTSTIPTATMSTPTAATTLRIGLVQYPGSFADPNNASHQSGLVAEVTSAAFNAVGISVAYDILPLPRAAQMLSSGQYKAILGSPDWLDRRVKSHYVKMFSGPLVFFYFKDDYPQAIPFQSLADLKRYKITVLRGSVAAAMLQDEEVDLISVDTIESGLRMLSSGRADLMPLGETSARMEIARLFPVQQEPFLTLTKPLAQVSVGLVVNEQQQSLAQRFDQGLGRIASNGVLASMMDKYQLEVSFKKDF